MTVPLYAVPSKAYVVMLAARGTMQSLDNAIGGDPKGYLTEWVSVLNKAQFKNPVSEGVNFERVLDHISALSQELMTVSDVPFQYVISVMDELKRYEMRLKEFLTWIKDIKESYEYGTLGQRFAVEHLLYQQAPNHWSKTA
jgi:hypothetical protein